MPEAAFQFLTLNKERDEPEVGELREGEVVVNIVDGRLWVGDQFSIPIELGKNSKGGIISNALRSNYVEVYVGSSDGLPISLPNPSTVLPGTYQEITVLMTYADDYTDNATGTTDIERGYVDQDIVWDRLDQPLDTDDTPLKTYSGTKTTFIFKLFAFGPREYWFGKVIWADR